MRIHGKCVRCKKRISVYTLYGTREDYDKKNGKYISIKCHNYRCNKKADYHLNDLSAVQSPFIGLFFGIVLAISLILCYYFYDLWSRTNYLYQIIIGIIIIPSTVWGIWFRENLEKVKRFNGNQIRR
ncbi:MAG: hypothetical protein GQ574_12745 [Crocinitomix sp.]|nr:hypothetical protein [Crocinitomix sp.]